MTKPPLIGITSSSADNCKYYKVNKLYAEAISAAGGNAVILPFHNDASKVLDYIKIIDGLVLTGGYDVDPLLYGQNPFKKIGRIEPVRDNYEISLYRAAVIARIAVLAICKGCQIMNVAAGGTLFQDISSEIQHEQEAPRWYPTHDIKIESKSLLFEILQKKYIKVNSFHHQSIKKASPEFNVCARSPEGIIEAVEGKKSNFILGVQWHPEAMWKKDKNSLLIFKKFVNSSSKYSRI